MTVCQLIMSNITDFQLDCVGDVDLQFSIMLVRKANVAEGETTRDK